MQVFQLGKLRIAPEMRRHAEIVHGHEDGVSANEGDEKMPARHAFAHHAAEHFREPVVGGGKDAEDGSHAHDEMEVADDEIRVVQLNIQHGLCEEWSADSARDEQRNKSQGEQHRRGETNASTPDRAEPVKRFDGGGNTDGHGHYGKGEGGIGAHAAHEHVMAPDHEAEEADGEHGVDHGLVAKNGFAREDGEQLGAQTHGGKMAM